MSFEHKAFVFNHALFEHELKTTLEYAIEANTCKYLQEYITANLNYLKDPYEGERLNKDWEEMIDNHEDPDQYGDFAITKFYNPTEDIGLGSEWVNVQGILLDEFEESSIILGFSIEKNGVFFDPGKMGSYFQSTDIVIENKQKLDALLIKKSEYIDILQPATYMFECAIAVNKGLYISF